MDSSIRIRNWLAIVIGVCILVGGAAIGFELTAFAGNSGFGGHVPVYIRQSGPVATATAPSGMGFAPILSPALPAIVSITSSRMVKVPQGSFFNNPFFQQFFGGQSAPQEQHEEGLGSGVIVSADGYILTNNHVIDHATDIQVILQDKRVFTGKVVGSDSKTDIAVVKIAASNLPTITLGDSSKLQVGDYAFAIGNPFGVGETATMGIISATGRNGLDIEDYEDFIQTDAAINPGNSGGALLNAHGDLIGINTAILAGRSGGNQGIGFAIPINMAKYVMDQILKNGKVVRGYIGVGIQELTPNLAKAFHAPAEKGALVSNVEANSPGAKAGLKQGDVITELNGEPVKGPNDLRLKVGTMAPGTTVHLKVLENGQTRNVTLTLGEEPRGNGPSASTGGSAQGSAMQGVQVQALTSNIRQQLGLSSDVKGVVVTGVAPGSPASNVGLQQGDVIEQVNREPVNSVGEYQHLVNQAGNNPIVLLVNRAGATTFVVVRAE